MPPSLRRTTSEPSRSSGFYISASTFSLFGPWSLPANPVVIRTRSNRSHSISYSPYPTTRQAVVQARTSNRSSEHTRRVLGEIDWWIVSSGQCDDRRDDSDDVEWESTADEEELTTEAAEPTRLSAATAQDNVEDDAQSESNLSESSLVENEDTVSPVSGRETTPEKEPAQRAPSPFFPIRLPPLTPLLSSQMGFEPSRRSRFASRALNRSSTPNWDYTNSTSIFTTTNHGTMTSSSPSMGYPFLSKASTQPLCRGYGVTSGTSLDAILRAALLGN